MVRARHLRQRSEFTGGVEDSAVVGCNDDAGKGLRLNRAVINVLDDCDVMETGQRLSGKPGGSIPGRDNAQNFARHTRSYHVEVVRTETGPVQGCAKLQTLKEEA